MKHFFAAIALVLSSVSMATSPMYPGPNYQNIVNISVGFGTSNSLYNTNEVLRPYRGDLLKVSVPASCGFVQIGALQVWGRTLETNQRLQLPLALIGTEPSFVGTSWTYQVNGGRAATVRDIGMLITTNSPYGCQVSFEQANSKGGNDECNANYACPMHVDNTRYCEARSFGNLPSFVEDAHIGSDNSCVVSQRLKGQICRAGYKPSQFQISCN